jgi:hypothetical protein
MHSHNQYWKTCAKDVAMIMEMMCQQFYIIIVIIIYAFARSDTLYIRL